MAGAPKPVVFTYHARLRLTQRGLSEQEVVAAVRDPRWTGPDPRPGVRRAFARMEDGAGRILRVAYVEEEAHIRILSAHPDRNARPPDDA